MAQSATPLFQKRTFDLALSRFLFPADLEQHHGIIRKWVLSLQSATLDAMKEVSLHGAFLQDIFNRVLGYRSVIDTGATAWELDAEQSIAGGGAADGALGFFTAKVYARLPGGIKEKGGMHLEGRVIAPIELKGSKNDLDRPTPGRKESAVKTNFRNKRLRHRIRPGI